MLQTANPQKKIKLRTINENRKVIDFIAPMLAKETSEPFDDANWIYEIKWDGYRAVSEINNGKVKLYSRNGLSFENTYPPVTAALKKLKINAVLDGEIIVLNDQGLPEFQLLQHYNSNRRRPVQYYVFDILFYKGKDTTQLPLIERKELLKKIIPKSEVIKYSDHIQKKGKEFFKLTADKEMEGVMAKKADSLYQIGRRTTD
ncbi:hypothetical protein BH09BAC2_BH09BAC2_06890 [soil metagenome]